MNRTIESSRARFSGAGTVGSFLGQLDLGSISLNPTLGTYNYTGGSTDELSLSISSSCGSGGLSTGSIIQSTTTLDTTAVTTAVPEPSSLILLGSGLAGLVNTTPIGNILIVLISPVVSGLAPENPSRRSYRIVHDVIADTQKKCPGS